MRGGPRLMCSPYLTGSLGVMLVLVSFNYWSVSTQNHDLLLRIQQMQKQLEIGSENVIELERNKNDLMSSLKSKDGDLSKCREQSKSFKQQSESERLSNRELTNKLNAEIEEKKSIIRGKESVDAEKDSLTMTINKLNEEKETLQVSIDNLNDDKTNKDKRIEELGKKLEEIRSQVNVEKNDLEDQKLKVAQPLSIGGPQLPDVDPAAVNVTRKETFGSAGLHLMPTVKETGTDNISEHGAGDRRSEEGELLDDTGDSEDNKVKEGGISTSSKPSADLGDDKQVPPPEMNVKDKEVESNDVEEELDTFNEAEEKLETDDLGAGPQHLGDGRLKNLDNGEAENDRLIEDEDKDDQDPNGDNPDKEAVDDHLKDLADDLRNSENDPMEVQ